MQADPNVPRVDCAVNLLELLESRGVKRRINLTVVDEAGINQGKTLSPLFLIEPGAHLRNPSSQGFALRSGIGRVPFADHDSSGIRA